MTAIHVRGSNISIGKNHLNRMGSTMSKVFEDSILATHAEMDLIHRHGPLKGGTVYVGGRKASSSRLMMTTKPCSYCAQILAATDARWVVYLDSGTFTKCRIRDLIGEK